MFNALLWYLNRRKTNLVTHCLKISALLAVLEWSQQDRLYFTRWLDIPHEPNQHFVEILKTNPQIYFFLKVNYGYAEKYILRGLSLSNSVCFVLGTLIWVLESELSTFVNLFVGFLSV